MVSMEGEEIVSLGRFFRQYRLWYSRAVNRPVCQSLYRSSLQLRLSRIPILHAAHHLAVACSSIFRCGFLLLLGPPNES